MNNGIGIPLATLSLLVITSLVSIIAFASPGLWRFLALEPYRMIRSKEYHAIITSGFVHGGFLHLLLNMWVLYMFGSELERILGSIGFLIVYGVSLILGSIYPLVKYRNRTDYIAIGASGAVSGIVFSFCLYNPFAKLFLIVFPMPAFVFAILYVGYSIYAMKRIKDNIGHEAHLGGALGGALITIAMQPSVIGDLIRSFS